MTWKKSLSVLAVLAAAVVLLYRKSMRLYWTYDDPWFLNVALLRGWTEGFTHRDIWHQNLFTPLLTATYDLLASTLWLEPRRWYAAQLVLLIALAFAVFAALRLYVDEIAAATGALLFIIGPPLANVAAFLGVIHYVEAMLLTVLAFIAFARGRDVVSAVLYFIAILAKEIAAPLPALLFLIDPRPRRVVPHAVAVAVYTIWRLGVVGLPVGGYGWAMEARDLLPVPWKMLMLFGIGGVVLLAVMLVVIVPALRTKRAWLIAIVGVVLAVGPILPVAKELAPRYALMLWLWACAGLAIGLAKFRWRWAAIVVTIVVALVVNRQMWTAEYTRAKRMSDEAYVWVHERGDVLLRNAAIPPGTMPYLRWLKEDYFHHAKGAGWFYDDIYLCAHPPEARRILEYRQRRVVEIQARCTPSRVDVPLATDFELQGDTLLWRFGPYTDGTWRLILLDGEHAWDVPRESAYRLGAARQLSLRVGYRSPAGWTTYTPEIALDFTRQTKTTWRR